MSASRWRSFIGLGLVGLLLLGLIIIPQGGRAELGIDYILIRDAPNGGGSEVGDRTYISGQNETYYAAGYNNTTGYVEDVVVWWWSDDTYVIEVIAWKEATNATVVALEYGITKVSVATSIENMTGPTAHTGNLTVISDIDTIVLRSGSGDGEWYGDKTVMTDTYIWIHTAGYNNTRGFVRNVPVYPSTTKSHLLGERCVHRELSLP
ncbi:MAG: hypothetical protein ACE5IO_08775, partial [Thermoplasmata archaeon]